MSEERRGEERRKGNIALLRAAELIMNAESIVMRCPRRPLRSFLLIFSPWVAMASSGYIQGGSARI